VSIYLARKTNNAGVQFLNIDGKLTDNHHMISDSLNNYFLTTADKINTNNANFGHFIVCDIDKYLYFLSLALTTPFPKIKFNHTATKEIENIIKSLKPKYCMGMMNFQLKF
jgi:hypothetical protein